MQFYAFDMLVGDGEDLRRLPLTMRKANLAKLLRRRVDGIFLSDFEEGEIGPDLFRQACQLGLKGLCPSSDTGPTGPAGRRAGSKSKTRRTRFCEGDGENPSNWLVVGHLGEVTTYVTN